jgi:hypothetical protein
VRGCARLYCVHSGHPFSVGRARSRASH